MKIIKYLFLMASLSVAGSASALQSMSDTQMSDVTGQALFMMGKTAGTGISSDTTFYKMGLDAVLELNTNIQKLQLGCGGVNGIGCDIDIDNLSLSGNCTSNRPTCDAVMTRPFVEFAIKGDNAATRQIVGYRLSSEMLTGLMTAGTNDGTANGINQLSGYFQTAPTSGTTKTAADNLNVATNVINGKANFGGCVGGCPANFNTTGGTITVPAISGVNYNVPSFNYYGCRLAACGNNNTTAIIAGISSIIPDIALNDAGPISAKIPGCVVALIIPLCGININSIGLTGTIRNLKANITLNEPLGYLHSIPLDNPFSLSFQRQPILWPGMSASYPAQTGWFMSVVDQVELGDLSTPPSYSADISSANANFAAQFSTYFTNNPLQLTFGQAVGGVIGAHINPNVGVLDFSTYAAVAVPLSNLPLGATQNVTPNCFGTSKFC